jgi:hypothetical protein
MGILEFVRERVADVLRACCGHVALSGDINVSDVSREFLIKLNLYPLVSTFVPNCLVDYSSLAMSAIVIDPQK